MHRPNDRRRNLLKLWLRPLISLSLIVAIIGAPAFTSNRAVRAEVDEFGWKANRFEQSAAAPTGKNAATTAQAAYGKVSVQFEANHGQTDAQVQFITRAGGATVFLTRTAAVFLLSAPDESAAAMDDRTAQLQAERESAPRRMHALRMNIAGANETVEVEGVNKLPGIVNYFKGNDPAQWHANIPTFSRVHYSSIYPGIDLVYYGTDERQLEYDFVVKPGSDASQIALNFEGANGLEADANGDLLIETPVGALRQRKPVVYQEVDGMRREVESGYEMKSGGRVGFRLGAYDVGKPLVIDPVLAYSTYLGGGQMDSGRGIAVDAMGNAYVTGTTFSTLFPTTPGAFNPTINGSIDLFVTKLNAAGSGLIYSTFLGGDGNAGDNGSAIAVDSLGNAYVTGVTFNASFPTTAGAFDTTDNLGSDGFVTKLNATGSVLVYSTYLGGSLDDGGNRIAVDGAGNAYVTGDTNSEDFPTTAGAFDNTLDDGRDAFVTKLNATGSALVYSSYFGGSDSDSGHGIAVDSTGNAYVSGTTSSGDFPTTADSFDTTFNDGASTAPDGFVVKLNPGSSGAVSRVYSTYLGGSAAEDASAIAVDSAGNAYVTGDTTSFDFPITTGAFATMGAGDRDAFVSKLNAAGSFLSYSTFLGGENEELGNGIAVDAAGNAYVTGRTASPADFPTTPGAFATTSASTAMEAFATKVNAGGDDLAYSTYLGGFGNETGSAIAVDSAGNIYITGQTFSSHTDPPAFPTTATAFQPTYNGGADSFVTKFGDYAIIGRVVDPGGNPISAVLVSLTGTDEAVTQTDAGGNFAFLNTTAGGNYTVTPTNASFTFEPSSIDIDFLASNQRLLFVSTSAAPTPTPTPTPGASGFVQFVFDNYIAAEDCSGFDIAVTRNGDTSSAVSIDYATSDGTAKQKGDYGITLGTISFAPGETNKIIRVLITEDEFVEGDEQFTLNLFSPTGGIALAEPSRTTVTITDDDTTATNVNPIDDTEAFVCQHYHDFLNREPDTAGELFWINNIESCGTDAACRELKRTDTSAAFFLSIEFQGTGFYAIRLQRTAFGKRSDTATTRMTYDALVRDSRQLGEGVIVGEAGADVKLAQNKQAYATQVVTSAAFIDRFPIAQTAAQYVDALYASAEVTPTATERTDAITAFGGGGTAGRVAALRSVVESQSIINAEVNPAFVLLQYHGYLRRNPTDLPDTNDSGYQFWLTKLNSFGGDFRKADMVKAFITSAEYRQRFGQQ
jgi:hypothetical protein